MPFAKRLAQLEDKDILLIIVCLGAVVVLLVVVPQLVIGALVGLFIGAYMHNRNAALIDKFVLFKRDNSKDARIKELEAKVKELESKNQ